MAELLFIKPKELTSTTIMGGNVDADKYKFCILSVQNVVIEPLLGMELMNKIKADYLASNLSGLYLEIFNDYIKPIVKYESCAEYIEIAGVMVNNGGLFKHLPDNAETLDENQTKSLSQKYHSLADTYVLRLQDWLKENDLEEYDRCDSVNVQNIGGWSF